MEAWQEQMVFAIQSAVADLLEVAESLEPENSEPSFRDEAEATVLRLIAAIVVADGRYSPREEAIVSLLINTTEKSGGAIRYLNEFAARWRETQGIVPEFFKAAVSKKVAPTVLQLIQLIGFNMCACDNRYGRNERKIVEKYISFLEDYLDQNARRSA